MGTVPLHSRKHPGLSALVDDDDLEEVSQHKWYLATYKHKPQLIYAYTPIRKPDGRRTTIKMHSLLTGWPRVDHKNRNTLDNQRANLRPATHSQNNANSKPRGSSSRFKGVHWSKADSKWRAQIRVHGVNRHLGRFTDEMAAAQAYDLAAFAAWGDFARTNFPVDVITGAPGQGITGKHLHEGWTAPGNPIEGMSSA